MTQPQITIGKDRTYSPLMIPPVLVSLYYGILFTSGNGSASIFNKVLETSRSISPELWGGSLFVVVLVMLGADWFRNTSLTQITAMAGFIVWLYLGIIFALSAPEAWSAVATGVMPQLFFWVYVYIRAGYYNRTNQASGLHEPRRD